jgi:hypothetical protein
MAMPVSEKNFLEKIAGYLPGIAGYREREARRETDRRLRDFLAGRLDHARGELHGLRNKATDAGELKGLDVIGRLDRALQKSISSLRYADYGYSGMFDQVKIREAELEQIYAYDESLVADAIAVSDKLGAAGAAPLDVASLTALAEAADQLDLKVVRRREILEKPTA